MAPRTVGAGPRRPRSKRSSADRGRTYAQVSPPIAFRFPGAAPGGMLDGMNTTRPWIGIVLGAALVVLSALECEAQPPAPPARPPKGSPPAKAPDAKQAAIGRNV